MTAGLHVELSRDGPSATNLVVGGANKIVKFPLSSFLHLEDRESGNDEALVELVINPPSITFPANKFVTDWQPITEMFRDLHVTNGAIVRWSEKQVLCRFRFRSNIKKDGSSRPTLLLEARVLSTGTWGAVPESKKQLLSMDNGQVPGHIVSQCGLILVLPHPGPHTYHGHGVQQAVCGCPGT